MGNAVDKCCAPAPRARLADKTPRTLSDMEGPKDGFYNATPAQPSHYYYLRSSSNNGTPGSTYAAGDNYVLPKMQQPCQSPPMASPPVHAAATTPGVEGASSPPVNGPPVNGVEDAYTAMIRAATVMVVPNTGVDELKKHVREVMMTMTEVRVGWQTNDAATASPKSN
eukprot:425860-Prymnesium_polylepis.1